MHTIKLVVIGASGVGKTSLRGQYISGQFSAGYRATIGADFIAKTLPHPTNPQQNVTLQIWDTAGQERFSSLSTAFFRGADAVIMMYDISQGHTLDALPKWWAEFCERAPLADEDIQEYPCFIVGNKVDLENQDGVITVSEEDVQRIVNKFLPPENPQSSSLLSLDIPNHFSTPDDQPDRSPSINIKSRSPLTSAFRAQQSPTKSRSQSRTRSLSKFGTVSSMNSGLSVYHTPSSSVLSHSTQATHSSPEQWATPSGSLIKSPEIPSITSPFPVQRRRRLTEASTGSSNSSAVTITPSLFARERMAQANSENPTTSTTPEDDIVDLPETDQHSDFPSFTEPSNIPLTPKRGPSLHYTSAKTGEGVKELFEHVAARVIRKAEYEQYFEARQMHYRETSGAESIRLGYDNHMVRREMKEKLNKCC